MLKENKGHPTTAYAAYRNINHDCLCCAIAYGEWVASAHLHHGQSLPQTVSRTAAEGYKCLCVGVSLASVHLSPGTFLVSRVRS